MKILLLIGLTMIMVACPVKRTYAHDYHQHVIATSTTVVKESQNNKAVAATMACTGMSFIPSPGVLQGGLSLGGYDDQVAGCVGGAITAGKDGVLVNGRATIENDKGLKFGNGWSVGGTWRFK